MRPAQVPLRAVHRVELGLGPVQEGEADLLQAEPAEMAGEDEVGALVGLRRELVTDFSADVVRVAALVELDVDVDGGVGLDVLGEAPSVHLARPLVPAVPVVRRCVDESEESALAHDL